jgi:DNA modification methylase
LWQIGDHRLICGDCRNADDVARLVNGRRVNGVFTSPPYAEQRKAQYGGAPTSEYVEWWEAVQSNMRGVLTEDGSFFVNIKPHCEDGQRVLYVFDLVLAMVRLWEWRFVDELCWVSGGYPGQFTSRFKNGFEPVYHFAVGGVKHHPDAVRFEMTEANKRMTRKNQETYGPGRHYSPTRSGTGRNNFTFDTEIALPSNVLTIPADRGFLRDETVATTHSATFPVALPTFFVKAYSDPGDTWLDPFCGSGTTIVAAHNEGRIGYGIERLPKYCAVILERLQAHTGITPELLQDAN